MKRRTSLLAALCLSLLLISGALAQYPTKAIHILVPNPPGGATDTLGRIIAPKLSEYLGQPVVVENRPASNGNMSSELTARAAPDGYTLLIAPDSQIVVNPHLYARMAVDTLKDLQPVASLVNTQLLLAVNAALPAKSFPEFIELARQSNPPLAYASIGNGSMHHLAMEMLKARAGIPMLHVPYKGGGPATLAILSGEVPAMFGGNSVSGHVRSGKLRPLALAGKRRSTAYPDIPTLGEFYPGLEITTWIGVFAPQGLPEAVLAKLRAGLHRLMKDPEILERIRAVGGLDPFVTTPEEFAELVRADHAKYGRLVKSAGVKID